jgi:sigma-B regulation protein RsbU (phosphoserine phosphatase)
VGKKPSRTVTNAPPADFEGKIRLELMRGAAIQRRAMTGGAHDDRRISARFYNRMAGELGGDFYRLQFIEEDRCLAGCFDVAGKNISAALVASELAAFFETVKLFKLRPGAGAVNSALNALVRALCPEEIFVTAALVYADFKNQRVEIHNFGFPPVCVFTGKDSLLTVPASYPPLGIEENPGAKKGFVMPLKKQLRAALFSDGLIDMKNPKGVSYGMDRCLALLTEVRREADFAAAIEAEIRRWCGKTAPGDDITVGEICILS